MNSKMSRTIIVLATITLASYGEDSTCRSTYDAITQHQYDNSINCALNQKCLDAVNQFRKVAEFTTSELASIIHKEEFKFKNNRSSHPQSENVRTIMKKFTPACQRYTDVMTHKHHLQHHLFNENQLTNATVIIQLALVIIRLQIMANSLETVQIEINDCKTCIKFTPDQYRRIYRSRWQYLSTKDSKLDAICLLQMRTRIWQNSTLNHS